MGVADDYKTEGGGGNYISSSDFDAGLRLEVVGMAKFTPENAQYGVSNQFNPDGTVKKENWFIKEGILESGDSFRYKFKEMDTERVFENNSLGFYFKFTELNPNPGDIIWIKRDYKSQYDINWTIEKYHDQQGAISDQEQSMMDNSMDI